MIFCPIWMTCVYTVGAFSLWGGGWLATMGAVDFSGGYVIHLAAGTSGFVAAAVIGPRLQADRDSSPPNNLLVALAGAGILWLGWNGFNGGDPYFANAKRARPCSTPMSRPRPRSWSGRSFPFRHGRNWFNFSRRPNAPLHHCTKQAAGVDYGCLVFTAAAITITSEPVLDDQFDLHMNWIVKVALTTCFPLLCSGKTGNFPVLWKATDTRTRFQSSRPAPRWAPSEPPVVPHAGKPSLAA